jgi:hypothetical protein
MDKDKLKYVVLKSKSSSKLTETVNEYIENGWEPSGSHQVIISEVLRTPAHMPIVHRLEYSQTLIRD